MLTKLTGAELRNSVLFDVQRQLQAPSGEALLNEILGLLSGAEARKRALKVEDVERRRLTASVLLANLAAAAINRVDPSRFVAVAFSNNAYSRTGLGIGTMTALRDLLLNEGLVEGRAGVRREDPFDHGYVGSSLTRLRATQSLRDRLGEHGVSYASIGRRSHRGTMVLRSRRLGVEKAPPPDVAATATTLEAVNAAIAGAVIDLPSAAWDRIIARHADAATKDKKEKGDAGDLGATALFRSFRYDWQHGGRLYGGWWIGVPSEERPLLTINGEAVVELDYALLHPSILFARAGRALDFDLYTLPGLDGPSMRNLGKDTFARLLNDTRKPGQPRTISLKGKDRSLLPRDLSPQDYMSRFRASLAPIERYLLIGEGLRLQREDSDLALDVLKRMAELSIVALPIHDSFIVQEKHGETLRKAMVDSYVGRYGRKPVIR